MLDPLGDTLAERHLRRTDIAVDLVSLLQKLNLGSEMKLAHALQDGLAGLLVGRDVEGRIPGTESG
jgi:hypothetical protein